MVGRRAVGLAAALAIAVVASLAATRLPVVGAPVIAIVLGLAVSAVGAPPSWKAGTDLAATRVLQAAIVVLGLNLSVRQVLVTGWSSLPVLVGTLVAALVAAAVVGRLLGLRWDLKVLIGVGTAICGASAIAAVDAVIDADEVDVAFAVATIFTFNVVAVLSYPALGHLMGLSQHAFGLWAGTAINDTSSVVAAATKYGAPATSYAVVVKLTRTLAIVPISVGLAAWAERRRSRDGAVTGLEAPAAAGAPAAASVAAGVQATGGVSAASSVQATGGVSAASSVQATGGVSAASSVQATGGVQARARVQAAAGDDRLPDAGQRQPPPHRSLMVTLRRAVPGFLVVFVVAVACNSAGLVPRSLHGHLTALATFLVTTALAGIGCSARVRELRRVGIRPILLGAALWAVVGVTSLALQAATGTL